LFLLRNQRMKASRAMMKIPVITQKTVITATSPPLQQPPCSIAILKDLFVCFFDRKERTEKKKI